jgi:hypothetical protein
MFASHSFDPMIRSTILLIAIVLHSAARLGAQEFTTAFYPLSSETRLSSETSMPTILTDDHVVAWDQKGSTIAKRSFSGIVFDRASKQEVHRGTIPLDPKMTGVEMVLALGKDACIIYRVHDNKEYHVTLYALRIALPGLEPVGDAIKLGFYDFPNNGNPFEYDYWFSIAPSPDKSKWGILLGKRYKDKKEQEFACWMKDGNLAPLWEHVFRIPTEADQVAGTALQVTNAGEAFALFSTNENKGNVQTMMWTESDPRWPLRIGKIDANGLTMKPVSLGQGLELDRTNMLPYNDGFLIGGRVVEEKAKSKTCKVATVLVGRDLEQRSEPVVMPVPGTTSDELMFVRLTTRGSQVWVILKHGNELICLVGDGNSLKLGGKVPFSDLHSTFTLTAHGNEPVAAFYDLTKNIEAMKTGGSLRTGPSFLMEPAFIHWGIDGKPTVKRAITDRDGVRDVLKNPPRTGWIWVEQGVLLDKLAGKNPGLLLIELK